MTRFTEEEKQSQLTRLCEFQAKAPDKTKESLDRIKQAAMNNDNVFAELMHAVRYCSLGQVTQAVFKAGSVTDAKLSCPRTGIYPHLQFP